MTAPVVLLHGLAVEPVRARISVPETLMTDARIPAMSTTAGDVKPMPLIRTSVPPNAVPIVGLIAVICILAIYRNAAAAVAALPELTLRTRTSTGPVTAPDPLAFVSRAVGVMTSIVWK